MRWGRAIEILENENCIEDRSEGETGSDSEVCHDGGYLELWNDMAEATHDAAAYGGCQGRDEGEKDCCGDILGSWELELGLDVWQD